MECEKLAQEKTDMQRHYVMVSTQNYTTELRLNLNVEVFMDIYYLNLCSTCNVV